MTAALLRLYRLLGPEWTAIIATYPVMVVLGYVGGGE